MKSYALTPPRARRAWYRLATVLILAFLALSVVVAWLAVGGSRLQAAGLLHYVAPGGVDSGSCAVSAPCATIQRAIDNASAGDEIRVAAGRYTHVFTRDNALQSIYLDKSVTLRGGYTTTNWATSDPDQYPTIVDAQGQGHALRVDGAEAPSVIGFHLTNGAENAGAGVYLEVGGLLLEDCEIYENVASSRGGGLVSYGTLTLRQSRVYSNSIAGLVGGGGVNVVSGTATIEDCEIYANSTIAGSTGGGIQVDNSSPAGVMIRRNAIYANSADAAAGVLVLNGRVALESNLIFDNVATSVGGGVYVYGGNLNAAHDTIYANQAGSLGGGIYADSGVMTITNGLIVSNTAGARGGGIYSANIGLDLVVSYVDFYANSPSHIEQFTNTIAPSSLDPNNRVTNPLFVDPASRDLHLSATSPAIDSGTASAAVNSDYEREGRPFGAGFDRGADEYTPLNPCFARLDGYRVYTDVQSAVDDASSGSTVQVAGYCAGVTMRAGVSQVAYVSRSLSLRGGYTTTDWSNPVYGPSTLDGQGLGRGVYITGSTGITSIVENLHITGGSGEYGGGICIGPQVTATLMNNVIFGNDASYGGGISNEGGYVLVQHNTIYSNTASLFGGGVYARGVVSLTNTAVVSNYGSGGGGGIFGALGGQFGLSYNNLFGNRQGGGVASDYGGTATPDPSDISVPPRFVDAVGGDFHVSLGSEMINVASPATVLVTDFDNDARPQGLVADIGVDESLVYAAVEVSDDLDNPRVFTDTALVSGQFVTFTHTMTNTGNTGMVTDTYDVSFSNDALWDVTLVGLASPQVLTEGQSLTFQVVVSVPHSVTGAFYNETAITITSQTNAAAERVLVDVVTAPGLKLTPDYSVEADPGQTLVFSHILTNTGVTTDDVTISVYMPHGWGTLLVPAPSITSAHWATTTVSVGSGLTASVKIQIDVPTTAAANLEDIMLVTALSGFSFDIYARAVDTTTVNPITGNRYVVYSGENTDNNCTQQAWPCRTIGYALNQAVWGDTVVVAQGIYNESSIVLDQNVSLVGGYIYGGGSFSLPGGGIDPRDTVIDAQGNGRGIRVQVPAAFHPVISGFTIQNGSTSGYGGAIYVQGSSAPALENLIILDSSATRGGAVYIESGSPSIENVLVASTSAGDRGGGLYVGGGSPVMQSSTISDTSAVRGGGVYLQAGNLTLADTDILTSSVTHGGGIYQQGGQLWMREATLFGHTASGQGAGVHLAGGSATITNTRVHDNVAASGGGFYAAAGDLDLWNNLVFSNTASTGSGGGFYVAGGDIALTNNTLYANQAAASGGGVYDSGSSTLMISNTIIVSNTASTGGGLYRTSPFPSSVDYNDVWGNSASTYPNSNVSIGVHSFSADPQFVDAQGGDLHILYSSPCVDTAAPATDLAYDIDGDIRPINQAHDIGADEVAGCLARLDRTGDVYGVVQEAVDDAVSGDLIQVSGICRGVQSLVVGGQTYTQAVFITETLTLEGGYSAGFIHNPEGNPTTLDAQGLGRVIVISGPVSVRLSYLRLVAGDASGQGGGPGNGDAGGGVYAGGDIVRVEGGRVSGSSAEYGGGVYLASGQLILGGDDLTLATTVISNTADYGGGLYLAGGTPSAHNVTFQNNSATIQGGGLYNGGSVVPMSATNFYSNTATTGGGVYNGSGAFSGEDLQATHNDATIGGGFYNTSSGDLTVLRSVILSNTATLDGSGLFNAGTLELVNSILAFNSANGGHGGGLYNNSANLESRHNTFYGNYALNRGGGIYHNSAITTTPIINSSLIVDNTAGDGAGIYIESGAPNFDYNDVVNNNSTDYGGTSVAGSGNISLDPQFISVDAGSADFLRLPSGSPAEDAGDPDSPVMLDIEQDPRPTNRGFDIGADEVGGCYVRINGDPPTYGSVQLAVNLASANDEILVAGLCRGVNSAIVGGQPVSQTVVITRPLTVRGGYSPTNWTVSDPISSPTFLDALDLGRVVYVANSAEVVLEGLHLRNGQATQGGAVFVESGVLSLTGSLVYSSTASEGGALYNQAGDVRLYDGNEFYSNAATYGGAIYNAGGQCNLDSSGLYGNQAVDGGAFFYDGGTCVLQNNVIRENQASDDGGGVYVNAGSSLTIWHNTFAANSATDDGGGLFTEYATPSVVNNVFYSNVAGEGDAIHSTVTYEPDYNDTYPGTPAALYGGSASSAGAHNLFVDPLLTGDYHLQPDSPVVDRGDPAVTLYHDFEGDMRPGHQGFDMGADELPSCRARIVRTGEIYGNVQWAVYHSQPGDVIHVTSDLPCRGVHPLSVGGQVVSQTLHLTHELTLIGGYDSLFAAVDPDEPTVLAPMQRGRAMLITNTTMVTVSYFALSGGDADGMGGGPGGGDAGGALYYHGTGALLNYLAFYTSTADYGGGIYDAGTGLVMNSCAVVANTAGTDGGGIYNLADSMQLNDSEVHGNSAPDGGGIYNDSGEMTLLSNNIYDNDATGPAGRGGGLFNSNSDLTLDLGNRFYGNVAGGSGGGIYHGAGDATIWNTLIYSNHSTLVDGAGIYIGGGSPDIFHNTFYQNEADSGTSRGGAIFVGATAGPTIENNIFDQNDAANGTAVYGATGNSAVLDYNDYWIAAVGSQTGGSLSTGSNNFNVAPEFEDPGSEDFHLLSNSALIDVGTDLGVGRDFEDDPRPINTAPDIGADEYNACLVKLMSNGVIYGRIQEALDIANPFGDAIRIAEGFCEENITIAHPINISGQWLLADNFTKQSDDVSTLINGLGRDRVITITSSADSVTLSSLDIISGTTSGNGGGIRSSADSLTLDELIVMGNEASAGGGVYIVTGTVNLVDVSIWWNTANSGDGGGLYIGSDLSNVQMNGVSVAYNDALTGHGGGVYVGSNSHVDDSNGSIFGNYAGQNGGGLYAASGSNVYMGGGSPVQWNIADNGGGVYCTDATFTVGQKRFNSNSATSGSGGGVYAVGTILEMTNPGFYNNDATGNGGGLYRSGGSAALYHATISWNDTGGQGGGVYNLGNTMVISASIISDNTATGAGSGVYAGSNIDIAYTLRWQNYYSGTVSLGVGNRIGDPRFFSPSTGDLLYDSPAIDAIPSSASHVTIDRVLDPRPQLCAKDMGRDEYAVGLREMTWVNTPDPVQESVLPGEAFTYTFSLRNDSENWHALMDEDSTRGPGTGYTETVVLNLDSSRGWSTISQVGGDATSVVISSGSVATFTLRPGGTAAILVRVDVPPGTWASLPGIDSTKEFTTLSFEAQQCPTADIFVDTSPAAETWVAESRDFVIEPNRFGTASPGETVTYTHLVTNTGNITDTYSIYPMSGYYSSGEIAQPASYELTLGPLQTATVVVSITIDPAVAAGLVDLSNVIAQSTYDAELRSVLDTTTVGFTSGTRYVSLLGSDSLVEDTPDLDNNCTQLDLGACRTVHQAVSQASDGDEIWIAQGVYTGVVTTTYQSQSIVQLAAVSTSVTIRGGYWEGTWDESPDPDHISYPVVLDAQGNGRAIYVTAGVTVTLDRLVLRAGDAAGLGGGPSGEDAGGNLYNDGAALTVTAGRIYSGSAQLGGGLYSSGGDLVLQNSLLHDNQATPGSGGAVYVYTGTLLCENDTFFDNTAAGQGGALSIGGGSLLITNTIVVTNTSAGGAVHGTPGFAALDYNLFFGNAASDTGGTVPAPSPPNDVLVDPEFVDIGSVPPDLYIGALSPARDTGKSVSLAIDYANNPRPTGLAYDIGAYERQPVVALSFYSDTITYTLAGNTLYFEHVLKNQGDVTDTFTITSTSTYSWPTQFDQPLPYQIQLGPGPIIQGTEYTSTVHMTVTVPLDAKGLTNDITITSVSGERPSVFGSVLDRITVLSSKWEIGKVATPQTPLQPFGHITYTLTVTNVGDLETTGTYVISDRLPLYTHFVSAEPLPVATDPAVIWNLSTPLTVGEAITVSFVVSVTHPLTDGTQIVNDAYTVYGGGAYNQPWGLPVTVDVDSPATLIIDKSASHDPVQAGGYLTYTITVTNALSALGPALGVIITDTLPADVSYQSMGLVPPASGTVFSLLAPRVSWTLDDPIPVGGSVQVTVTGRVTSPLAAGTAITNLYGVLADNLPAVVVDHLVTSVDATNSITLSKTVTPTIVGTAGTLTYTVVLTNTGNGVAEVTLTDAFGSGFSPPIRVIPATAPGRTWDTTEGVSTVVFTTTAPITEGIAYNQWVTATYDLTDAVIVNTAPVNVVIPSISTSKQASEDLVRAGDPLTYTIRVTNTCGAPLHTTITDTLPAFVTPTGPQVWEVLLAAYEVWTQTLPVQADWGYGGPLSNEVAVTTLEGASDSFILVTQAYNADMAVSKEPNVAVAAYGDTITYTYRVTNTGSVTLTGITAFDDMLGPITLGAAELAPSLSTTGIANHVVQLSDIPGPIENTVVVTATPSGQPFTINGGDIASVAISTEPAVLLSKGPDYQEAFWGTEATFHITVTNVGGVELTGVEVFDTLAPDCARTLLDLEPGDRTSFFCTRSNVTASFINTALVTTQQGASESDTATVYVIVPDISVDKMPSAQYARESTSASFTIAVTNTGNITLTNITVTDTLAPDCNAAFAMLGLGAFETYTCSMPVGSTSFTNAISVTAAPPAGPDVTDRDDALVTVIHPSITITKTPDSQAALQTGTATFTITVENTGDIGLSAVTVTDPLAPDCDQVFAFLDVGLSQTYSCALANPQDDFLNIAYVSGTPPVGPNVTDQDGAYVNVVLPDIAISKRADTPIVRSGETADFTIFVTNTGDYTLTNVIVQDALVPDCDNSLGSLGLGGFASYTCSETGVLTDFVNSAMVTADVQTLGGQVSDSDTAQIYVGEIVAGVAAYNDSPTELVDTTHLTATVTAGTNVVYTWDFGDGTTGSGATTSHVYPAANRFFTATVTASNRFNAITATTVVSMYLHDGPDLVVTGMWITPTNPAGTHPITISARVENQGNLTVTQWIGTEGWFWVELYAKQVAVPPSGPLDHEGGAMGGRTEYIATYYGPKLGPGEFCYVEFHIVLRPGTYYFYLQPDITQEILIDPWGKPYGVIPELDESNVYEYDGGVPVDVSGELIYLPLVLRRY